MMIIILCCVENEEILTVTAEELQSTLYEGKLFAFNVYPFGGKE